jgi:hypothetical protein
MERVPTTPLVLLVRETDDDDDDLLSSQDSEPYACLSPNNMELTQSVQST